MKAPLPADASVMDRRQFVRTSSGLLIAAGLADACNPSATGPIAGIGATGTVRVVIIGLGLGVTNGGSVLVTRTDLPGQTPATLVLDGSGTASATAPAGTYQAVYTPPPGYQSVTSNVVVVTVTAGVTTDVSVTVSLIVVSGTLRVTVTGLTGAAATGGSASLLRTDIAGQLPIVVPIPLGAPTVDTIVSVGTYSVTYTAPGGFTVSGVAFLSIAVTVGATFTATFAARVAGLATAGDIYEFGFEDGTSGAFTNSSLQPFLGTTNWVLDATTPAARGTKSVKQVYPLSLSANVGTPFFKTFPPRTDLYVRVMYRQQDPFNKSGVTNNYDQVKLIRVLGPGFTGIFGSLYISNSLNSSPGVLLGSFSDIEGNQQHPPNLNLPAPNMNSLLNSWVCIEVHWDITTTNALHFECWINGVQYYDYLIATSNLGKVFGVVQFDGTINSMQQASTAWFDSIGISTQRMGFPT